jgi:hypothetical protein
MLLILVKENEGRVKHHQQGRRGVAEETAITAAAEWNDGGHSETW